MSMIRLIVSDVDGTLLPRGAVCLPDGVTDMVRRLQAAGIAFAAASGRTYRDLARLFAPVADQMYFICSDGAALLYRGELLCCTDIPLRTAQAAADGMPDAAQMVLHGVRRSYIQQDAPYILRQLLFEDAVTTALPEEPICKLALYGGTIAPPPGLRLAYQDANWQEWVAQGADKGAALTALQARLQIAPSACAAFGDGENDIPLLRAAGCRFAMTDAAPALKHLCGRTAADVPGAVKRLLNSLHQPY